MSIHPMTPYEKENRLTILQTYFICLSQALAFLHNLGIRHKDIKPKNILVDEHESVLLSDFGISRKIIDEAHSETSGPTARTYMYSAPEVIREENRGRPSDIFSLGCVFLEMATLILGKTLEAFVEFRKTENDVSYHKNLDKIRQWLEIFMKFEDETEEIEDQQGRVLDENADRRKEMVLALAQIQAMLSEIPKDRPKAPELWNAFSNLSSFICIDCDPRASPSSQGDRSGSGLDGLVSTMVPSQHSEINVHASNPEEIGSQKALLNRFKILAQAGGPESPSKPESFVKPRAKRGRRETSYPPPALMNNQFTSKRTRSWESLRRRSWEASNSIIYDHTNKTLTVEKAFEKPGKS